VACARSRHPAITEAGIILSGSSYVAGALSSIGDYYGKVGRFGKFTSKALPVLGAFESGWEIGKGIIEGDWDKIGHGSVHLGLGLLGTWLGLSNPLGWIVLGVSGLLTLFDIFSDGAGESTIVRPVDPNEKKGPEEPGLSVADRLQYTIYFENVPTATVPAQEVFIVDDLDPHLDWTSLRFEEIAFGERVIPVTDADYQFSTRQTVDDYRTDVDQEWWVDISGELNPLSGRVKWTFRTLDPQTGALPEDVWAGFLPPNDETGRGEGHIILTIQPRADAPLGQWIHNAASIVFDTNDPIETNTVRHVIGRPIFLPLTIKQP
jgi:hypothetical protein